MQTLLAFGFGVFPALVALWLVDRLDRKRPEPPSLRRLMALAGGLITVPVIIVEVELMHLGPQSGYAGALFKAFVVAAMTEELAKAVCLRFVIWNRPEFDERMDGIVYAARAGLGFALVENVAYMFKVSSTSSFNMFLVVAAIRALVSVPGHPLYAGIMGYHAARRRFDGKGIGLVGGWLIAVVLHGIFDAALLCAIVAYSLDQHTLAIGLLAVPLVVVVFSFITVRVLARRALAADDADPTLAAAATPEPA